MEKALVQAELAKQKEEVAVGCVIVDNTKIIAQAHNETIGSHDPTAHAEILAIRRAAAKLKTSRLVGLEMYVTLEPCLMCAVAIAEARLRAVYFGAYDKGNLADVYANLNHSPQIIGGVMESQCSHLLKDLFKQYRLSKSCS